MNQGDLERHYREAGRELRTDLLTIDLSRFSDDEAQRLRKRASLTVSGLHLIAAEWTNTAMRESALKAERKARIALQILGYKQRKPQIFDPGYNARQTALESLIQANNSILGTVNAFINLTLMASLAARFARVEEFQYTDAEAEINEIARQAVMAARSRGALQRQIKEYLYDLIAADKFIEINGKVWKMSKYSKLVARTEMRTAQSAAIKDMCDQFECDLVVISSHGTLCDICGQYEGGTYSISGRTQGYEILPEWPPFHPNCMHSASPTSEAAIIVQGRYGNA